jgi:hypothetical protein
MRAVDGGYSAGPRTAGIAGRSCVKEYDPEERLTSTHEKVNLERADAPPSSRSGA